MSEEKKEVLLIDDEPGFHELFRYLLEPLGIAILSAHDGLAGLKVSSQKEYAIIFLDVHMPNMPGTEVLKKIKEMRPLQRVVLLSSDSDPADELEEFSKKMGVDAFLEKPFHPDRVLELVQKIMGVPAR
ncbi:MAG: response regulator [Elusimicrobia bacterium]|nr:response regulator [Elusimicrobiota bacterium]